MYFSNLDRSKFLRIRGEFMADRLINSPMINEHTKANDIHVSRGVVNVNVYSYDIICAATCTWSGQL